LTAAITLLSSSATAAGAAPITAEGSFGFGFCVAISLSLSSQVSRLGRFGSLCCGRGEGRKVFKRRGTVVPERSGPFISPSVAVVRARILTCQRVLPYTRGHAWQVGPELIPIAVASLCK
jgi:hypothetical protein